MAVADDQMPQPMVALKQANKIRMAQARMKRELRVLPVSEAAAILANMLVDLPEEIRSEPVFRVLLAVPKVGKLRANKWLMAAGVFESMRPCRLLSARQRLVLASELRAFAERSEKG